MGEGRYSISQVVEKTKIKSHTIRYWEDELELTINRNNMGHRYYSNEDIQLFLKIKELKDLGYQLKAIKMLLPDIHKLEDLDTSSILQLKDELNMKVMEQVVSDVSNAYSKSNSNSASGGNSVEAGEAIATVSKEDKRNLAKTSKGPGKMLQFQDIMRRIVLEAVKENNAEISETITENVTDSVIKEMDYLFRVKEDREEERFKKLDETIRGVQKSRQEVAATTTTKKKKNRLFRKS